MFDTLIYILLILIWPLCLFIIGLVLLQGGAGDMSSAFGGGGQLDSTLGVGAGRKMSKLTGWMVFAFLAIVTILAIPHGSLAASAARKPASAAGAGTVNPPANAAQGEKSPQISSPAVTNSKEEAQPSPTAVPPPVAPEQLGEPDLPFPVPAPAPPTAPAPQVAPVPPTEAPAPAPEKPTAEPAPAPHSTLMPQQ